MVVSVCFLGSEGVGPRNMPSVAVHGFVFPLTKCMPLSFQDYQALFQILEKCWSRSSILVSSYNYSIQKGFV